MNEGLKNLIGSPSRDTFKQLHKRNCPNSFYACDLDFILVAKYPFRLVAFIDYKKLFDKVTFAEAIAYNELKLVKPVYIIRSRVPESGPFFITRYEYGNPKPDPPDIKVSPVKECKDWQELSDWEDSLRTQ